MYDLTSVLTTIAACSASIVAIIGGFIASKLIAISAEREETETRISELNEEIIFYTIERDHLQRHLDEDDALDFIKDNLSAVTDQLPLNEVYKVENHNRLEFKTLEPYWNQAVEINKLLWEDWEQYASKDSYEENEDGISCTVVQKLNSEFEYSVCKSLCEHYVDQNKTYNFLTRSLIPVGTQTHAWYYKTEEQVIADNSKIELLELHKRQLVTRMDALKNPKGMKSGLALFTLFSVFNIIIPLVNSPFYTDDYNYFLEARIYYISAFSLGLGLIILYLRYLLHWKKQK